MHLALAHIGQRRLAKTNPHEQLCGIGLNACDQRASSLGTWCGLNLLDQALEHMREILRQETITLLCNPILSDTPVSMDRTSVTVFEVDPVIHIGRDTTPYPTSAYTATLAAFTDLVADDYAQEVRLTHTQRVMRPSYLDKASIDQRRRRHGRRNVRNVTVIRQRSSLDVSVQLPRPSWSDFGCRELLSTHRQAQMTIQFDNDKINPVSKHNIQPECGECTGGRGTGRWTFLARQNSQARTRKGKHSFYLFS